jgi:hypothetical protein
MFKAQYKRNSPYESWIVIGTYNSEQAAISAALQYKRKGVLLVRVTDKKGAVIYSN